MTNSCRQQRASGSAGFTLIELLTVIVILVNLLVDLAYAALDPRVRVT